MKKSIFIIFAAFLLSSFSVHSVFAGGTDSNCKLIYGGGEVCASPSPTNTKSVSTSVPQFEINKFVNNPQTQVYVEELTEKDPMYRIGEVVSFKLTMKNNASTPLSNITIKDTFPETVEFNGGAGIYDNKKKVLSLSLDKLGSGESRDFYVQATIVRNVTFSDGKNVACSTNSVTMTAESKTVSDKVQFCIANTGGTASVSSTSPTPTQVVAVPTVAPATTKGGLPVYPPTNATTTPPTGPEEWSLLGLIPTAVSGFLLRRKTRKNA